MRLRTFTATDMPAAMKLVRKELGAHAIILAQENLKDGKGVRITAAVEIVDDGDSSSPHRGEAGRGALSETNVATSSSIKPPSNSPLQGENPDLNRLRRQLQSLFQFHNVPDTLIAQMMDKATDKELSSLHNLHKIGASQDVSKMLKPALEKILAGFFTYSPLPLPLPIEGKKQMLMLVGSPGIGKTLAIAKLATKLTVDKHPVSVITTDTKRAGGVEQLQAFTTILGIDLRVAENPVALARFITPLKAPMTILIDTSGCNPFMRNEMEELKGFSDVPGVEPVLVMPAGGDSLEASDIVENFSMLPITRLLVTRTDTARRFGSVIAAASATGLALSHSSNSPSPVDALQPLTAGVLAQLLLRYQMG